MTRTSSSSNLRGLFSFTHLCIQLHSYGKWIHMEKFTSFNFFPFLSFFLSFSLDKCIKYLEIRNIMLYWILSLFLSDSFVRSIDLMQFGSQQLREVPRPKWRWSSSSHSATACWGWPRLQRWSRGQQSRLQGREGIDLSSERQRFHPFFSLSLSLCFVLQDVWTGQGYMYEWDNQLLYVGY